MKPLIKTEYERLNFDKFDFNLIRIKTEADGSCFFHAIAKSYSKTYITGKIGDKAINRKNFIRNLRKELSTKLGSQIDSNSSKTYYEKIAKGELPKISKTLPEYSLENMQKELDSYSPVSNIYNELISDLLNIDIYILDGIKKDVYMTGTDDNILYKNRRSIVILYLPLHYELVGIINSENRIETYFSPNSSLIKSIRNRMKELRNSS